VEHPCSADSFAPLRPPEGALPSDAPERIVFLKREVERIGFINMEVKQ